MPARGYEFYLLVVNSKIKFISTRGHVISSIYIQYFRELLLSSKTIECQLEDKIHIHKRACNVLFII